MKQRVAVLALGALCLGLAAARHVDDSDASLYTVVARHLVADGSWINLRYLDDVHPVYREHLPFGLWPLAASLRAFGEASLPWVSALWSWLTLVLVIELGARWKNLEFGLLAGLVLIGTERFVALGALPRLDPPMIFFSLGACVPALLNRRDLPAFVLTVIASSLACLIKGPFGLVLPATVHLAVAISRRDWKWLATGIAACMLAVLPTAAFLARADASWTAGYVNDQLLASATGTRTDGESSWWFPLASIGTHFWPWLPIAAIGLWLNRTERTLGVWLLAVVVVLAIPHRKLWHHVLVAFPVLALLAATALEGLPRNVLRIVVGIAFLAAPLSVALVSPPRAASCTRFDAALRSLPEHTVIAVVADPRGGHWRELATLARDYRLRPTLVSTRAEVPLNVTTVLERTTEWQLVTSPAEPSSRTP